jgi:hypothetical protein
MSATVTLSTTTLAQPVSSTANEIKVASTSGLTAGKRLFVDGEAMSVVGLLVDPWVKVTRGVDGTRGAAHSSSLTVYIANGDQLYTKDPAGIPPAAIQVSPWINLRNGKVWFAMGDTLPDGNAVRWWQEQTATHDVTVGGVRTVTYDPTAST